MLQMDRIDPLYYAHSDRIDLKDETRINADSNEAEEWRQQNSAPDGDCSSQTKFQSVLICL